MSCSERAFRQSRLLDTHELGPGIKLLSAAWEGPAPRPGQFFMLRPERSAHFLARPLSVLSWEEGRLGFLVAERGGGTRELCALEAGGDLLLSGPLGSPWPLPAPPVSPGRRPAFVAGGVGLAPLAFLAASLEPGSYDFYAGFRSSPFGLEGLSSPGFGPARLIVSSEEGRSNPEAAWGQSSLENPAEVGGGQSFRPGRILDHFEPEFASELYVCGPEGLLAAAAALSLRAGLPAWLSLERRMACGVGACLGCTVRTKRGNRRACVDGPIFPAEEVIFDENH